MQWGEPDQRPRPRAAVSGVGQVVNLRPIVNPIVNRPLCSVRAHGGSTPIWRTLQHQRAGAARHKDRQPMWGRLLNLRAIVNRALVLNQQLTTSVSGEQRTRVAGPYREELVVVSPRRVSGIAVLYSPAGRVPQKRAGGDFSRRCRSSRRQTLEFCVSLPGADYSYFEALPASPAATGLARGN